MTATSKVVKPVTNKEVYEALGLTSSDPSVLTLSKGVFTYRMGYYWRPSILPEDKANYLKDKLTKLNFKVTIIDSGDHFAAFRGGENTKKNSHYWIKMKVERN